MAAPMRACRKQEWTASRQYPSAAAVAMARRPDQKCTAHIRDEEMQVNDEQKRADRPRQDNGAGGGGGRLADDLIMGLRFFSRLPTGARRHERPDLSRMARALPFISLVIGLPPA